MFNMDEKPPPSRRSSGHSDKTKKSGKKKKKNKHKDRKRGKVSSPDETNSDSALELGRKRVPKDSPSKKKSITSAGPLPSNKSTSSVSVGLRKSNSSSGSDVRFQNEYLEKCVSDIFDRSRQSSALSVSPTRSAASARKSASSGSSRVTVNGRDSSELENEMDDVSEALNESLRWDNPCSNPDEEQERIRLYKYNRRKRYLMDIVKQRRDKEGVLKFAMELASDDGR